MTTPTQTRFPNRAAVRTFIATVIPAVILALTAAPEIVTAITNEPRVPDGLRAALVAVAAGASALAGILTRIMAIKAVNEALAKVDLAAQPKALTEKSTGKHATEDV